MAIKPTRLAVAVAAITLAGCTTFSQDGGYAGVSVLTKERTGLALSKPGSESAIQQRVGALLAAPLSEASVVEIALINNKGLQTEMHALGIAEADFVQAGRLPNPHVSFARSRAGHDVEIERAVGFDFVQLLTIPMRRQLEGERFEQAKMQLALSAVQVAATAKKAYFNAIAAKQGAEFMAQAAESAQAAAELSERMRKVGNISKLQHVREQAFYAETMAQVARSRDAAAAAREELARVLGVGSEGLKAELPNRLPDLPAQVMEGRDWEQLAIDKRLDVAIAKRQAEATARSLGLTRQTGVINAFEVSYVNTSESDGPRSNGYELSLQLPIFDWGGARVAKAESIYMQSVSQVAHVSGQARSQVRQAYGGYQTRYQVARHYRDEIVPLRKQISEEVLARYNGMLIGVFELLADARAQIASVNNSIEAQRDFWIADTDLHAAIYAAGGSAATASAGPAAAAAEPQGH